MTTITRYRAYHDASDDYLGMDACDHGDYVYFDDHDKLVKTKDEQIEWLKEAIRGMQNNPHFDFGAASEGLFD